jgi:hypothetical protein
MATVIFVAATLTVVSATSAAIAIKEFKSGTEDRKAAEALNYAESGIDRMVEYLRGGTTFGQVRAAGCDGNPAIALPQGKVGNGTYDVELHVQDCNNRPTTARDPLLVVIHSEGTHPAAKRIVELVVEVDAIGLPVGVAANNIDGNGTPDQWGISMITNGKIVGRNKLDFEGTDPWYKIGDFWPTSPWADQPMPAAAHAVGGIFLKSNVTDPEFTTSQPKNCSANKSGGTQSLWDSDGSPNLPPRNITSDCSNNSSNPHPPNSVFTQADYDRVAPEKLSPKDRLMLKQAAKNYGQYCFVATSGSYCIRQGVQIPFTTSVAPIVAGGTNNFIAYYEFEGGNVDSNNITFGDDVWGCNDDPELNKSMVLVVERGGVKLSGNAMINGAFILDGGFDYTGTPTINGTILAKDFWIRGTANFTMDECWVNNMPGPWLTLEPVHWSEVDR